MPLTASVVGAGMGGRLSLNALAASPDYTLVAAADLRPDVRADVERLFSGLRTFATHDEMFAACPTDVVCVSTYPDTHERVAVDALALPLRGILVEKPLADTAAGGRRILDAVKARGLPVAVPHGMVAKRTPLEVIERVRGGEIGALQLVEIQCRGWDILNAGIHWLHFCLTLLGPDDPAEWVMAQCDRSTRTWRDGLQVETLAVTTAQTRSGARIVLHTGDETRNNDPGHAFVFRLIGAAGRVDFYGWEHGYRIWNAHHPAGRWVEPAEMPVTGHRRHLEALADQIAAGTRDTQVADASLAALELCEGAYRSARHGGLVRLPLGDETPSAGGDWDPGRPYAGTGGGRDGRQFG